MNDPVSVDWEIEVIPGIGSLQMLGAAFGETMEDALLLSVHGRNRSRGSIALNVTENSKVFFLCSKDQGPAWLSQIMLDYHLDDVTVFAGSNLSYEDQVLLSGSPGEMVKHEYPSLCVAMIKNPAPRKIMRPCFLRDEDFERDIVTKTPGKLHWKDSYIACFITASSTYPSEAKAWTCNEVTIYCPYPFWTEERSFSWRPIERDDSYPFLDYAYDLEYDFAFKPRAVNVIETGHYAESPFKMIIYGPCVNPSVTISGNTYAVNVTVEAGGHLVIDSRADTPLGWQVYLRSAAGEVQNVFNDRNPDSPILKPIPGGNPTIEYSQEYGVDLTLYIERSEPSWSSS